MKVFNFHDSSAMNRGILILYLSVSFVPLILESL